MSTGGNRKADSLQRRQQILDAALELFVADGVGATSLRRIAAAAGMSTPGLLHHFSTKAEIVIELFDRADEEGRAWAVMHGSDPTLDPTMPEAVLAVAELNEQRTSYADFFTALVTHGTAPASEVHERIGTRYEQMRSGRPVPLLAAADGRTVVGPMSELAAVWDGLQILSLFLPGLVDTAELLRARFGVTPAPAPAPDAVSAPSARSVFDAHAGYAPGRQRRLAIVAAATRLFRDRGYLDVSFTEIARAAGIPKSGVMLYFPRKELLVEAVLDEARSATPAGWPTDDDGDVVRDPLAWLTAGIRRLTTDSDYLRLRTIMLGDSLSGNSLGHRYFAAELAADLDALTALLGGRSTAAAAAHAEAAWLLALREGLLVQWLYAPSEVELTQPFQDEFERLQLIPGALVVAAGGATTEGLSPRGGRDPGRPLNG